VCDWFVTVKVWGILVVSVTCKNKQKKKWKTQDKATTRTTTITKPTTIITTITKAITIIRGCTFLTQITEERKSV